MAEFLIGQVVISRQGKDAGLVYVVGSVEADRVNLIRPPKFNTTHMKSKNPKHLQPVASARHPGTSKRAEELIAIIEAGQDIDAGYFHRSVMS